MRAFKVTVFGLYIDDIANIIIDILPSSESGHQNMSSESSILSLNQGFASFPDFNFNQDILQFDLDLNNFNFYQDIFPFDDTSQVLGSLSA